MSSHAASRALRPLTARTVPCRPAGRGSAQGDSCRTSARTGRPRRTGRGRALVQRESNGTACTASRGWQSRSAWHPHGPDNGRTAFRVGGGAGDAQGTRTSPGSSEGRHLGTCRSRHSPLHRVRTRRRLIDRLLRDHPPIATWRLGSRSGGQGRSGARSTPAATSPPRPPLSSASTSRS